jgi:thiamine-phosphate pyrophosphorylase
VKLYAVTDRRLLGGEPLGAAIARLLDRHPPGDVWIQLREKDLDGGALLALARDALAVTRPRGARLLVNDRLDVALAAGADGVHLPEDGLTIAEARAIAARPILVGCSRHSADGVAEAARAGADLVVLGPIWATPSKQGAPLGVAALTEARARITGASRLCAIGGIEDASRAAEARAAGADAVAAIRAVWAGRL